MRGLWNQFRDQNNFEHASLKKEQERNNYYIKNYIIFHRSVSKVFIKDVNFVVNCIKL